MPTSAQIKASLSEKLINRATITQQEPVYSEVGSCLDDALNEHMPDAAGDYACLPSREHELVLLLAWERVCFSRASFYAPQPSLNLKSGAPGFGSDRDTPFKKCTDLAAVLRKRYELLSSTIKDRSAEDDDTNASGDITIGELVRADDVLGVVVPLSAAPRIRPVSLKLDSLVPGATEAVISWTSCPFDDYAETRVLLSQSAGIYQNWNSDGSNGVPYSSPASSTLFTTHDPKGRALKITGILAGVDYFVVVVVSSLRGDYAYSNELTFKSVPPIVNPVLPGGLLDGGNGTTGGNPIP